MTALAPDLLEPESTASVAEETAPTETETPAAPVTETATESAAPIADDTGRPRDPATGKFLPKQPATDVPTDGVPPTTEPAPATTEAVTTESVVAASETPWSMKVDGQTVTLDGAVIIPGKGILFPEQHADLLHRMLGRGIKHDPDRVKQQFAREREEIAKNREEAAAEKAQLSVIGELATAIFSAKSEDELAGLILDLWQNKDGLQREAEFRRRQALLDAREKALAPSPEAQKIEIETKLGQSIEAALAEARTQPWANQLKVEDWKALAEVLRPLTGSFLMRATEDVPAEGLRQGDLAFNASLFFETLERQAGLITAERRRVTEEKKRTTVAAEAAARNTAAMTPSVKAPPSVASAEKPAPNTPGSGSVFTSREEFERWLQTGQ